MMVFSLFLESAEVYNAEFRKLADRLGVPNDLKDGEPYSWILLAARGDVDLANDMATYLLYGNDGTSPLAVSTPIRSFSGLVKSKAQYLPAIFAQKLRGTRSKKYAGNFTDAGLDTPDQDFDPPAEPDAEQDRFSDVADEYYFRVVYILSSATRLKRGDRWVARKLGIGPGQVPAIRKKVAEIQKQRTNASRAASKARTQARPGWADDTVRRYMAARPDGVRFTTLQSLVGLPAETLRVLLVDAGYVVAKKMNGPRQILWVYKQGEVPTDPRADLDRRVAELSGHGLSRSQIGRELNLTKRQVQASLERTREGG